MGVQSSMPRACARLGPDGMRPPPSGSGIAHDSGLYLDEQPVLKYSN